MEALLERESVSSCSSMDSGYLTVTGEPASLSSLDTVEKFEQKISETLAKMKELEENVKKYKTQIEDHQHTINTLRTEVRAAKDTKKFDVKRAQKTNGKLRRENKTLRMTIEKDGVTIRLVIQIKNKFRAKLGHFQTYKSKPALNKLKQLDDSDAVEKEIQRLNKKIQSQAKEIEENDKDIADLRELYEKAVHGMTELKDKLLKSEQREAERDMKSTAVYFPDASSE